MKIIFTESELMDRGLWHKYCAMTDYDFYLVLNGLSPNDEEITLTEEQLNLLGLYVSITKSE
ncbi:hypothetical protein D3C78_845450 [compost metagenome]